ASHGKGATRGRGSSPRLSARRSAPGRDRPIARWPAHLPRLSRRLKAVHVAELWRYPVKSMGGEQVPAVDVTTNGVAGDRVVQVWAGRNRVITARTAPKLLGLRGTWDESAAEPLGNGQPWHSPEVGWAVRRAVGTGARLGRFEGAERFDVLPLLVATDGAITLLGIDHRRLRPNIVIGGVDGLAEREWPGRRLRLGSVIIEVAKV